MRFATLHVEGGKPVYVNPERVTVIDCDRQGRTVVELAGVCYVVSETPEEALRIVEGADGTAEVVDAARRLIAWLDDSGGTYAAHEAIVHDLRAALAAYVKGAGR